MSHPDPDGPADLTPIEVGEVWTNPVTGDRATFLELPSTNPDGRCSSELTALVGAPGGEHRHPTVVERFTVLEGELTLKVDGQTSVLGKGETATIDAGVWHESWNASDRDAQMRVELTPGGPDDPHGRDHVGARTSRTHERRGNAGSTAAGADRARVQRRPRLPLAAVAGSACALRRPRTDCALARLSRDLPAALTVGSGLAGGAPAGGLIRPASRATYAPFTCER